MPFAMIGFFLGIHFNKVNNAINVGASNDLIENLKLLFLIVLCMVFARSAAMAFNRYLDYKIDAKNPRTAIREIPAGIIKPNNALIFTIICCLLFIGTTFLINEICFYLSFVALFVILFYSYTKRFTALCHIVLGVGLSLAPIGAFLAITGVFNLLPLLFSFVVLAWVSGFDIIYALQDESFDKENNLNSIPVLLGKRKALLFSTLLHFVAGIILIIIGVKYFHSVYYYCGAALFIGMLFYQHSIVKPNDLSKVNIAFMTANGIASVVFAFFVILHLLTNN